ncbi:hypothetical protein D3C85_729310 [compost metagenome]
MTDEQDMKFRFLYDGPALQEHQMDVKVIAPAMLAMGHLLETSNKLVNGPKFKVQARVNASFVAGSFGVDLGVYAVDLWQQTKDLLTGNSATAVLNLVGFLGITGAGVKGLIQLVKWVRNRTIDKVEYISHDRVLVIIQRESLEVDRPVLDLFRSYEVRQALEEVMAPLAEEGIDLFATSTDNVTHAVKVNKSEREWFQAPSQTEVWQETTSGTGLFRLVSLSFKEDNKWRFNEGGADFYAQVADLPFLERVSSGQESFANGDTFRVRYTKRQWLEGPKLRFEYQIDEVLDHIMAARQISLPFDDKGPQ